MDQFSFKVMAQFRIDKCNSKTRDGIFNYYYHLGYATFFDYRKYDSHRAVLQKSIIRKTDKVVEYSAMHNGSIYSDDNENLFNYLNLENGELEYAINDISNYKVNIHFWYKPSELKDDFIAIFKLNGYPYVLSLESGKIKIVYQGTIVKPNTDIKLNEWNLISVSFAGSSKDRIGVGLNSQYIEDTLISKVFPKFSSLELRFGSSIKAKISGIVVTQGTNCFDERNIYYELIREIKESKANCSGLMMYNSNIEYYPLLNSYNSLNDDKPRTYSSNDFASDFIFDTDLGRSTYFAHGQHILYYMNGFSFSVSVKFKLLEFFDYNPILSMPASSTLDIGCNKNGQIMLNDSLIDMTIDGNWHTLKYTYIMGSGAKLQIDDSIYTFSGSTMYGTINLRLGYEDEDKYSVAKFCDLLHKSGSEITDSDYNSYGVINLYDNLGRLQSFKKIDSNVDFVYNVYNKDLVTKVGIKNNQNSFDEYNYEYQYINGNPVVNKIIYQEQTKNEFVYDEFGRLTKEIRGNVEDNYSYDIRGNIVSKNGVAYYYESSFMDRVTKVGNDAITYDVIGNISSYKGVNYSYLGKKLTSVTSNNLNISFVYNDANQRIKKINNSTGEVTYYVYENDLLKFEYTGNNWISYLYLDGKVVGFRKNGGSPYYYIYDGIGNIVSIMNSNNERVVNYEYDAFGNVLSITGPENSSLGVPNHFRYKGYYYDTEINLYFLNTRYYSPELCRFISPDSVGYLDPHSINGLNLYAYCGNDPINKYDFSGHFAISTLVLIIVGAEVLTTAGAITYGASTDTPVVLDFSFYAGMGAGVGGKLGMSIVLDFKNNSFGFYPHYGYYYGAKYNTFGFSYGLGLISNYENEGDYAGPFVDFGGGFYGGIDHCYDPRYPYDNTVRASSITVGNNIGAYYGYDYYDYWGSISFDKVVEFLKRGVIIL